MREVNSVEILRPIAPLDIDVNEPALQTRPARKPASQPGPRVPGGSVQGERSSRTGEQQPSRTEVLISVSSTVAEAFAENGIDLSGHRLSFSMDEDTGTTVINIIDNKTDEVIKQIPPDEILTLKKRMTEIQGLLLDRKA